MARRVIWSPEALQILYEVRDFTERRWGGVAARTVLARLRSATRILREHPRIGRQADVPGMRLLTTVHPFVLIYRIDGDTGSPDDRLGDVEIVRIWHGAQDRAPDDPSAG